MPKSACLEAKSVTSTGSAADFRLISTLSGIRSPYSQKTSELAIFHQSLLSCSSQPYTFNIFAIPSIFPPKIQQNFVIPTKASIQYYDVGIKKASEITNILDKILKSESILWQICLDSRLLRELPTSWKTSILKCVRH